MAFELFSIPRELETATDGETGIRGRHSWSLLIRGSHT